MDSTQLIWSGGLVAHLILLFALLRKGRARIFPFFTALIVFYVLRSLTLFSLYQHISRLSYTWLFWSLALADLLLQTTVLAELLKKAFQRAGFAPWRTALGGVIGIAFAAIIIFLWGPWPSLVTPGSNDINPMMLMSILTSKGNLLVGLLTMETLMVLILVAHRSGLSWKSHVQRIAQGLAFYALINLTIQATIQKLSMPLSAAQAQSSMHTIHMLGYARTLSYFAAVLYWIVFLWMEEEKTASSS